MKPTTLYCTLTLMGCLLLSITPAAQGFIAIAHENWRAKVSMVDKVHAPHWDIAYSYGDDCPPEERDNDKALTAAVTEALQMWLQPLRDYAKRPIVNDFRYRLDADRRGADLQIIFHCKIGVSMAGAGHHPRILLREGTQVKRSFMVILVHEMGHTFGLADTYLRGGDNPELDQGRYELNQGHPTSPRSWPVTANTGTGGCWAATIRTASSGSTR